MAEHAKPHGLGHDAVGQGHASAAIRFEQGLLVAKQAGELAVVEGARRIGGVVSDPVCRVEQPLSPIGEKQPRQGMAKMMVGPVNSRVPAKAVVDQEIIFRKHQARFGDILFPQGIG